MAASYSLVLLLIAFISHVWATEPVEQMNTALARVFGKSANITILHVQHFRAQDFLMPIDPQDGTQPIVPRAGKAVTNVKLFIRTNGEAPALPSATAGTDVGIEFWFPEHDSWNGRIINFVDGGWEGVAGVTATNMSSKSSFTSSQYSEWASNKDYVSAISDGGHVAKDYLDTSYLLTSDNEYNMEGWKNIAWQATHLMAETSKAISKAYYGQEQDQAYLLGCSTGGRAAYQMAQQYPSDYNGIVAICPSITGSRLYSSIGYPTLIKQNDKHEPFTQVQLEILSQKAVRHGDSVVTGQHDGYITDWQNNTYDPSKDLSVLRIEDGGNCTEPWAVSLSQAKAIVKIWYGITRDGSAPDPASDNGYGLKKSDNHVYWGPMRGTQIVFGINPFAIVGNWWASVFKNASIGDPEYFTGGTNAWENFSYQEFTDLMLEGQKLDQEFINMDADDPDLTEFHAQGGKILAYHGLADPNVPPLATISYYERSVAVSGGLEHALDFHRLFLVPGMGHCNPVSGQAGYANIPLVSSEVFQDKLVDWVENGNAPEEVLGLSQDHQVTRPICVYPRSPKYDGKGNVNDAASFTCL